MKNSETLMLQDVWRQAFRREDGLSVTFKTKAGAIRARMQLYNAVKLQKAGKDMEDLELVHAAEQLEIVWAGETTLKLQRKDKNDMMQSLAEALGKSVHEYVDPEVMASAEKTLRELERLKGESKPELAKEHQANPFYKR